MTLPAFTFTARARPFLEVGLGDVRVESSGAVWDVARWNQVGSVWSGTEPTWLDISCEAFSARCEYGRARSTDRFVPGVATVEVHNATGWADPHAVDDPAALEMRPGRAIRFGVDHVELGHLVLWRGFIDSMTPTYEPNVHDRVTFQCVDALGEVNRAKLAGQVSTGELEAASVRVSRILNAVAWPGAKRDISPSAVALVAAELNGQAADLLGRTAESAGGAIFGDREGNVTFRARDWQTFPPGTPYEATIGNVDPGDVCPISWTRPFNRADIATRAIIGRDSATAVVRDDPLGQIIYGIEPFERVDLWTSSDLDLDTLARRALRVRSHLAAPVVRSVMFDAATASEALDLMATADPYAPTHYRCRLELPDRLVFDAVHLVTGIVHELTSTRWTTSLNLDLAAPYELAGGRWDESGWDYAWWSAPPASALAHEARELLEEMRGVVA